MERISSLEFLKKNLRLTKNLNLKFGMVQTNGCIDGAHILIKCPQDYSQDQF